MPWAAWPLGPLTVGRFGFVGIGWIITVATGSASPDSANTVVSERLGHAKVGITLDVYSHVLPSMDEHAAVTVARLILGDDAAP